MSTPAGKSLLRVEATERIDEPDFTLLSRQVLDFHESIVGSVLAQNAIVKAGWDLVTLSTTDMRVERNDGVMIGPETGTTDGIRSSGLTACSAVFDFGGQNQVISFAGRAVGTYHIYVWHRFFKANQQVRVKFNSFSQTEFNDTFEVRFDASWFAEILPAASTPGVERVRIATVDWDGSDLATSTITRTLPLLFEGQAVPGGSVLPHSGSGFTGTNPLVDFSRDSDRITNGLKSLAEFTNASLKCIEEIKSQLFPSWYSVPRNNMALDAVLPVTYTIGQGTADSVGMFNANGTTLVGGVTHYNISTALENAAVQAVVDSVESVVILLKPGLYYIGTDINIQRDAVVRHWTFKGAGRGSVHIHVGAFGAIHFEHGGGVDSASVQWSDMTITQDVGGTFIDYEGGTGVNRWTFHNMSYTADATATFIRELALTANPGEEGVWSFEDCDIPFGTMRLSARQMRFDGGTYGDVVHQSGAGSLTPKLLMRNAEVQSFDSQNDALAEYYFHGLRMGSIGIDAAGSRIWIGDCEFPEDIPGGSARRVEILGCEDLYVYDSVFEQNDAQPATFIQTEGEHVWIRGCEFLQKNATTFPGTWAVRAIGTDKNRSVVTDCFLESATENGFFGVDLINVNVANSDAAGLTGAIADHDPAGGRQYIIRGMRVSSGLSHTTILARDFLYIQDSEFAVPECTPGTYELIQSTSVSSNMAFNLKCVDFSINPFQEVEINAPSTPTFSWSINFEDVKVDGDLLIGNSTTVIDGRWNFERVTVAKNFTLSTNVVNSKTLNINCLDTTAALWTIQAAVTHLNIHRCNIGSKAEVNNGLRIDGRVGVGLAGQCTITECNFSRMDTKVRSTAAGVYATVGGGINDQECLWIDPGIDAPFHTIVVRDNIFASELNNFDAIKIVGSRVVQFDNNTVHCLYTAGHSAYSIADITADRITFRSNDVISEGSGGLFDAPRLLRGSQVSTSEPSIVKVDSNTYRMLSSRIPTAIGMVDYVGLGTYVVALFSLNSNALFLNSTGGGSLVWQDNVPAINSKHSAQLNNFHDVNGALAVAGGALPGMSAGYGAGTSINAQNAG